MARRRKSAHRRRSGLGTTDFTAAAKSCKGRPLAAFRSCMRTHLKK